MATTLLVLTAIQVGLGVATQLRLPIERPTGGLPARGGWIYIAHAVAGVPLTFLAAAFFLRFRNAQSSMRTVAWVGGAGIALAGLGGLISYSQTLRILALVLMLVGSLAALYGYLIPILDRYAQSSPQPRSSSTPHSASSG